MKILSKNQLKIIDQEEHTKTERDLMVKLSSPFLLNYNSRFKMKQNYIYYQILCKVVVCFIIYISKINFVKKAKFYLMEIIL